MAWFTIALGICAASGLSLGEAATVGSSKRVLRRHAEDRHQLSRFSSEPGGKEKNDASKTSAQPTTSAQPKKPASTSAQPTTTPAAQPKKMSEMKCPETNFSVTFNNHSENFLLHAGEPEATITSNCSFRNRTYAEGHMHFTCKDGAWNLTSYSCSDCPTKGCPATTYSLELSGKTADFEMQCAKEAAKASRKCNAFDKGKTGSLITKGEVDFFCIDGTWTFESHTCGADAGSCLETKYTVELESHSANFALPAGGAGSKKTLPCDFSDKNWEKGMVEFECRSGSWELKDNSCTDCPDKGCPTTEYSVTMGDHEEVFHLKCVADGAKTQMPCEFEDKKYRTGNLDFRCDGGEWRYLGQSCSENYEAHPSKGEAFLF